jgi:tripartite ATP-independent transporter DctM subunit
MVWLDRLDDGLAALARRIAAFSVAIMVVLAVLTVVETVFRSFFYMSLPGFFEVAAFALAVGILACFPASITERSHLVIDFIGHTMTPRTRSLFAFAGGVLLLGFLAMLAWRFGVYADTVARRGQRLASIALPMGPFFWAASAALWICVPMQIVVLLVQARDIALGRERNRETALEDIGDPTPDAPAARPASSRQVFIGFGLLALCLILIAGALGGGDPAAGWRLVLREPSLLGTLLFFGVWIPILLLVPLGAAMGLTGLVGLYVVMGWDPAINALGFINARFLANPNLAILPLFLLMGNLAVAAGLADDIYSLANILLRNWRGGLAHATIIGCAGFGAVTGSSVACAAAMGAVALPEMRRRGYSPQLASGCVAAGGTLGQLIPPSTIIVLYCFLTEVSIGRTLIAVLIPGVMTTLAFLLTVSLYVRFVPSSAPPVDRIERARVMPALVRCWAVFAMFGLTIGGLYLGIFTANEAAAVGAALAFFFALGRGKLKGAAAWKVMGQTAATTAMLFLIIVGAITFSFFLGTTQFAEKATSWILTLGLPPLGVIAVLLVIYLLLGTAMESVTILLITTPIVAPVVQQLGYDLVWWGIIMVMIVEAGIISPPYGMNMFIIQTLQPDIRLSQVFRGVMPFFFAVLAIIVILVLWPDLVLWLPSTMMG